jgi:hypothetical protein
MKRRQFMTGLAGAVTWPVVARAQQRPVPVIGYLSGGNESADGAIITAPFRQGLGELGYVEGQNVEILYRRAETQYDRLPAPQPLPPTATLPNSPRLPLPQRLPPYRASTSAYPPTPAVMLHRSILRREPKTVIGALYGRGKNRLASLNKAANGTCRSPAISKAVGAVGRRVFRKLQQLVCWGHGRPCGSIVKLQREKQNESA